MGAPFFCTSRRELEQAVYIVFDAADGDDALVQMRFVDPEVNVLLFTGIVVDWQELKVDGNIQKPFGSGEILDKVNKVLS